MFKLLLKLIAVAALFTGLGMALPNSKVSADAVCPTNGSPESTWGINTTPDQHGFASLTVHALDSASTQDITQKIGFTLNSRLPDVPPGDTYGPVPAGKSVNDRIFVWGPSGPGDPTVGGRTSQQYFQTGETLFTDHYNNGATFACPGWTVLGPGVKKADASGNYTIRQDGNGWVLDCQEDYTGRTSGTSTTHYWLSSIQKPGPGYWEVRVHDSYGNLIERTADFDTTPMTYENSDPGTNQPDRRDFGVTNGVNTRIDLIWHATQAHLVATSQVASSTVEPGGTAIFKHTVANTSVGGSANYNWTIHGDHPGDGLPPNGTCAGITSGVKCPTSNNNPNFRQLAYNVPDNAPNGTRYCQYISFSNASGTDPQTVSGASTPVCITVQSSTQNGNSESLCYKTSINTGQYLDKAVRVHVTISGVTNIYRDGAKQGDNGVDAYVPGPSGSKSNVSSNFAYTPSGQVVTISQDRQWYKPDQPNQGWHSLSTQNQTMTCYQAQCYVLGVSSNVPGGSGGQVMAGQYYHLVFRVQNTAFDANGLNLYSALRDHPGLGRHPLVLRGSDGQVVDASPYINSSGLGVGAYTDFDAYVQAPGSPTAGTITYTPEYQGYFGLGGACSYNIDTFVPFNLVAKANTYTTPGTGATDENPVSVTYQGGVYNGASVGVNAPSGSSFYKKPIGGGPNQPLVPAGGSGGTYNPGDNYYYQGTNNPVGYQAGDQFCTRTTLGYSYGYVGGYGPGDILGAGADGNSDSGEHCITVTNEPYFKVKNSGASAGVSIKDSGGACNTNNGGLLAGWNNNTNGLERGAGSQLSSLALVKITGFASAQTNITRSGTDLTFANSNPSDKSTDTDNPSLGGNYNATGYCINDASSPGAGPNTQTLPANSIYSGASNVTNNRSVFVNGDVYINGNVTYGAFGSVDTAPSVVLHATGNIYIAPGVTELDGLYMSDKNIYTCANNTGPITSNSYSVCKNQLLVYGNLIGKQLKLGRTFGSLRDEKPSDALTVVNITKNGGDYSACSPAAGPENSENRCFRNGNGVSDLENYNANYTFTVSSARPNYTLGINYDNYNNGPWPPPASTGYYYVVTIYVDGVPRTTAAVSAYGSYANFNLGNISAGNHTVTVSGYNNHWIPYGGNPYAYDPNFEIQQLTLHADGAPVTAPSAPACSNAGARSPNSPVSSCAAEVLQLSPELYLSTPAIQPPNKGSSQWDAVTSLPPVL